MFVWNMDIYIYIYICVCVCVCVCVCDCVCLCAVYIHTYVHISFKHLKSRSIVINYIYARVCVCVCVCKKSYTLCLLNGSHSHTLLKNKYGVITQTCDCHRWFCITSQGSTRCSECKVVGCTVEAIQVIFLSLSKQTAAHNRSVYKDRLLAHAQHSAPVTPSRHNTMQCAISSLRSKAQAK